jgi:hypothetical protein
MQTAYRYLLGAAAASATLCAASFAVGQVYSAQPYAQGYPVPYYTQGQVYPEDGYPAGAAPPDYYQRRYRPNVVSSYDSEAYPDTIYSPRYSVAGTLNSDGTFGYGPYISYGDTSPDDPSGYAYARERDRRVDAARGGYVSPYDPYTVSVGSQTQYYQPGYAPPATYYGYTPYQYQGYSAPRY